MDFSFDDVGADTCETDINAARAYGPSISRVIDVVLALAGIVFMLPLMTLIACSIWATDGSPVLFAHQRIGRGGRTFPCFKFRTMVVDSRARLEHLLATDPVAKAEWYSLHKLRRDPRITSIGALLRRSSFDEIPQLFNVLRGEMSIVGPRPIVAEEIGFYGAYFSNYCSVNPGITGFWQISGRNSVSYRSRVAMDVLYARRKSLPWDLKIMVMTVPAVLLARGSC